MDEWKKWLIIGAGLIVVSGLALSHIGGEEECDPEVEECVCSCLTEEERQPPEGYELIEELEGSGCEISAS